MIPYILAAVGGYLLGQSRKETYADGGVVSNMSNKEKGKVFSFLDDYNLSDEAYHWWERFGYTKDEAMDIENSWAISRGYKMSDGGIVSEKFKELTSDGYKFLGNYYEKHKLKVPEYKDWQVVAIEDNIKLIASKSQKVFFRRFFRNGGMMADGGEVERYFIYKDDESILNQIKDNIKNGMYDIDSDDVEKILDNTFVNIDKKENKAYLEQEYKEITKSEKDMIIKVALDYGVVEMVNGEIKIVEKEYEDEDDDYADGGMMADGGKVKSKKWIQDALSGGKNKGALRRTAAKKGLLRGDENLSKTDLKKLQKMGGTTAKRAHLAETLKKFDEGGDV